MVEPIPLVYPKLFQGMFARVQHKYVPLIEEARRSMIELTIPGELRPYYDYVVRDNPQPSFILLPLMFLEAAEATGGISPQHRRCLPVLMLGMETAAITDDTVDRTRCRSGRPTFPARFGEVSSAPFAAALMTLVVDHALRVDPRVFEQFKRFFLVLFADELWERQNLYPAPEAFERWLELRYAQCAAGISCVLDTSLLLNDRAPLAREVCEAFGQIFQDVDDIVNVIENRATVGENDDVAMGMITLPLLHTIRTRPELLQGLQELWELSRPLGLAPLDLQEAEQRRLQQAMDERYCTLRSAIIELGVPFAVRRVLSNCRKTVEAAPPQLRGILGEMVSAFVDRLRRHGDELVTEEQIGRALAGAGTSRTC